jgi:hypothetical protein
MVRGVSTRRYARSLEPLPSEVEVRGIGKSAVSERFVVGTQRRLGELMRRDLSELALVALMIDGVHFAEHVVLVAVCIERGLATERTNTGGNRWHQGAAQSGHRYLRRTRLGSRVSRAQKKRNVADALPERLRGTQYEPGLRDA